MYASRQTGRNIILNRHFPNTETEKILKFLLLFCEMALYRFFKLTSSKQSASASFEQENVDPDILIDEAVSLLSFSHFFNFFSFFNFSDQS